jgi:acetyl esterase/lipase
MRARSLLAPRDRRFDWTKLSKRRLRSEVSDETVSNPRDVFQCRFSLALIFACAVAVSPAFADERTLGPRDVDELPASAPTLTASYGTDALESGDLRLPPGKGPFPVVVVVHGGCWTTGFATRRNTAALASALTAKGFATWNIEYRQEGDPGGGWPGTFQDWAAATDYLRSLAKTEPIDLKRVAIVGHSAGAIAALWVASRPELPTRSIIRGEHPLAVRAAVDIDGPGDLGAFVGLDAKICRQPVVVPFMGGTPADQPSRYEQATPLDHAPLHIAQYLISSVVLLPEAAAAYKTRAEAAGDRVHVVRITNAGHFDIIAPGTKAWATVEPFILNALRS